MKTTVKKAVIDILKQEDINHVFGHTGSHIFKLCKEIEESGIHFVLGKQEGNATYMADACARISKKPAVVIATLGPGVTNTVTGAAVAYMDSVPLILIGGTVTAKESGRNSIQESSGRGRSSEQRIIFKEVCKQAMFAPSPEATPDVLREAFKIANSGRKGPVYIEIPDDFWDAEIEYQSLKPYRYQNNSIASCLKEEVEKIEQAFYKAKHPLVILGEGADSNDIQNEFQDFIEKIKVPFTVTPLAKNFVDEFGSYYLGAIRGSGETQKAYEYMKKSDFILFLGARMHDPEMGWDNKDLVKDKKLAQVDFDAEEIGRVYPIDLSAVGSTVSFIQNFKAKQHSNSKQLLQEFSDLWKQYPRLEDYQDSQDGINPINICNVVEKFADKDAIFVTDTGWVKATSIVKLRTTLKQNFIVSDKNGSMGFGIPASIGANLVSGRESICFVGDGGAQMSINELGVLLNNKAKSIFIIFNNGGCACMFDTGQKTTAFRNPDFVQLAKAYDLKGYKVRNKEEFKEAFQKAKQDTQSVIIEALIDQSIMVWE